MSSVANITEMTVSELLRQWPQTISVFNHRRMACVGCAFAQFNTVTDVAQQYRIALPTFVAELEAEIDAGPGAHNHADRGRAL